ncbi:MAG: acyl-CoA thioesterase [Bacteroidota bacterium]
MYKTETKVRVRYAETDRMGYVYYGNYATYLEVARVELLRSLGFSYRSLEDKGILLPVSDMNIRFLRPAFYDDQLVIRTTVSEKPGVRIQFEYEIVNESAEVITKASTTLVFIDKSTGRPCPPPEDVLSAFLRHF